MEEIERAAEVILRGGVVIFPTDTVYGIACNAFDDRTVERIYQIKNRPSKKLLPVLISDYTDLLELTETPSSLEGALMKAFWPGALTLVLEKKKGLNKRAFSGSDTVAVRMPDSEVVRALIREAGVPLATTSANLSGEETGARLEQIDPSVLDQVDFVLETPEEPSGLASTIAQVVDGKVKILREGAISEKDLLGK